MAEGMTPLIFIGHGSPMSALNHDSYAEKWGAFGRGLAKPRAILMVSAHWNIEETAVSDVAEPKQIYDFYGFPQELYEIKYPAKGSVELADRVKQLLHGLADVKINNDWGLDHGAWIPLRAIFPDADIPIVQLSLDRTRDAKFHYTLGRALKPLRQEGVMIIGSGDIVHNLSLMDFDESAAHFDWAQRFETEVKRMIAARDDSDLTDFKGLGQDAVKAIPTPEHYLPLLYVLAARDQGDKLEYFVEGIAHGSVSMTSFVFK